MKKFISYTAVFLAGAVGCVLALKTMGEPAGSFLSGGNSPSKRAVLASLTAPPSAMHRIAGDSVVADAAAKLEPAIVAVHTVGKVMRAASTPFDNDPIFRRFFGGGGPATPELLQGAGSGVIISPDGYILTNNHVVARAEKVTVNIGEKGYTARVIGTDPITDIAVVKIDTKGASLPVAALGNSDDIRVGDWAIAIGNPLDVGTTVTLGIISAKDRKDLVAEGHPLSNNLIQTDAAINPGNSGGALADINGRVIGINEAIYSPTGSYVGIGFAIPINSAKKIAADLIRDGKVIRPYLGISYAPLKAFPAEARQQMGISLTTDQGVVIQQVYPNSPAAQAGLKTYDVILEANRQKLVDNDSLNNIIAKLKIGDTLTLLVSRDGQSRILTATLREAPKTFGTQPAQPQGSPQGPPRGAPFEFHMSP